MNSKNSKYITKEATIPFFTLAGTSKRGPNVKNKQANKQKIEPWIN